MTDSKTLRDQINSNTRFLAFRIFNHHGYPNFAKAYDKLAARIYLDWNHRIDRSKGETMFDNLDNQELDKVYKSSMNLVHMYNEVLDKIS